MPPYPIYKLGEIAKIYNGNSINAEEKEKKYKGVDGRNYIGTKDIECDCSVNYSNGVRIPFDEKKFKIAPTGSVLVCAEGGSAGKKSAFITEDVCFGNKLFAITNNQGLFDGKYVFYYTRYKRFFDLFKNELSGLIGGVSSKKFGEIPIPLPPLTSQRAIVTRIESLFAELDKAAEHLRTAQQQLKTYRQAVLNHWLNNDDGKWKMAKLGDVADVCLGKMLDKNKNKGTYQPYLRNANVRWGSFDLDDLLEMKFEESEQDRYGIQIGDLIMCEGGEPGRCAIWNANVPNMKIQKALHRIRVKDRVYNKFVYCLFTLYAQNGYLEKYFTGTTIKHLTGQSLKSIEIPLPPLPEQQRIVAEIESRLSQASTSSVYIENALQQTEALRQSILKKAFSGELV